MALLSNKCLGEDKTSGSVLTTFYRLLLLQLVHVQHQVRLGSLLRPHTVFVRSLKFTDRFIFKQSLTKHDKRLVFGLL